MNSEKPILIVEDETIQQNYMLTHCCPVNFKILENLAG